MNFIKLAIPEVVLLEPKTYSDDRGFFFESFNHSNFEKIIEQKANPSCSRNFNHSRRLDAAYRNGSASRFFELRIRQF
jgi:dTDP-4-dehydrorhamnose 3,5-epimerase